MNVAEFDSTNIVHTWQSIYANNYYSDQEFELVFTFNDTTYVVKRESSFNSNFLFSNTFRVILINLVSKEETILWNGRYPECGTGVYLSPETKALRTMHGILIYNNLANACVYINEEGINKLNNSDLELNVINVTGQLKGEYLSVAYSPKEGINYFLENYDNINSALFSKQISFSNFSMVLGLAPLKSYMVDKVYAIMNFDFIPGLYLVEIRDGVIEKSDSLDVYTIEFFTFKNNNLYYLDSDHSLTKSSFDKTTGKFSNPTKIFNVGLRFESDINEEIIVTIVSDSLIVYSILQEKIIHKIKLGASKNYSKLLVEYPYIYFRKIESVVGIESVSELPSNFQLNQNYPNPFNPETTISYVIPSLGNLKDFSSNTSTRNDNIHVSLKVYDALGREVATLVDEVKQSGIYNSKFSIQNSQLSSSVYFYRLQAGDFVSVKKMMLIK
jgi:hypothetical protein